MNKPQSNLENLMKDPKAAGLLKNKDALRQLLDSPDTKRLMELLAGGSLKNAAGAAARGDTGQLMGIVRQVMESKEGARLAERIQQSVPK